MNFSSFISEKQKNKYSKMGLNVLVMEGENTISGSAPHFFHF